MSEWVKMKRNVRIVEDQYEKYKKMIENRTKNQEI